MFTCKSDKVTDKSFSVMLPYFLQLTISRCKLECFRVTKPDSKWWNFYNYIKSRLDRLTSLDKIINQELNQKLSAWVGDCYLSGCVVLVAFTSQYICSNRGNENYTRGRDGDSNNLCMLNAHWRRRKMPVTSKTLKSPNAFLNSTFYQGCCMVTSDHKTRRQSVLQDGITLILQSRSDAWFLQAKGTLHGSDV